MTELPTNIVDLARLNLSYGEGRRLRVPVWPGEVGAAGQTYAPEPDRVDAVLDVSRTSSGYALKLTFSLTLEGPCVRCLELAGARLEIEAREVEEPDVAEEELRSPYVSGADLDIGRWAHDAVALALPAKVLCRSDCAGLCPVCGESLNDAEPEAHRHGGGEDPRWARLKELQ